VNHTPQAGRLPANVHSVSGQRFVLILLALLNFSVPQVFILRKATQEDYEFNAREQALLQQSDSIESAEVNYTVGLAIANSSENKARAYIRRAAAIKIKLRMTAAKEYNSLGYLDYLAGEFKQAENNYLKARQEAGSDTQLRIKIYNNLANLKMEQADFDNASRYASISSSLGSQYSKTILAAIQSLKSIDEPTKRFYQLMDEGVRNSKLRKFEKAIAYYDQAMEIRPDNYRALNFKGYALVRLGRYDEAEQVLEKGVKIVDDYNPMRVNLLKAYCSNNKLVKAREFTSELGPAEKLQELFREDGDLKRRCKNLL
jgi:Flp pilus assembly protein TadD